MTEGAQFDLYVLDVVMPDMSGIDLGMKLRELGQYGAIVYLSVSPEYAVESYAVRAFYYLMKPVDSTQLYHVLDQALVALDRKKAACVTVKTLRTSFQEETAQLLTDPRFFQSGASFIVNLHYVAAVEKSALRMDSGELVPLARGRSSRAKQQWREYWLDRPAEDSFE